MKEKIVVISICIICVLLTGCIDGEKEPEYPEGEIVYEYGPFLTVSSNPRNVTRTIKYVDHSSVYFFEEGIPGYTNFLDFVDNAEKHICYKVEMLVKTETDYERSYDAEGKSFWERDRHYNVIDLYSYLGINDSAMRIYQDFLQKNDDIKNSFEYPVEIFVDLSNSVDLYGAGMHTKKNIPFNLLNYTHDIRIEITINEDLPDDFNINLLEVNEELNHLIVTVYGTAPGVFRYGTYKSYILYKIKSWNLEYETMGRTEIKIKIGDW